VGRAHGAYLVFLHRRLDRGAEYDPSGFAVASQRRGVPQKVLSYVNDPIIRGFFTDEYATWGNDYRTTAIDPVLNKIEQLLSAPAVRATVGTVTSSIDFAEIMDQRKILIANLSKGVHGPGHAQLLGSILVSGFSHAAMACAAIDERVRTRVPFFLFADEIQNFATDSFGEIASEARKTKLDWYSGTSTSSNCRTACVRQSSAIWDPSRECTLHRYCWRNRTCRANGRPGMVKAPARASHARPPTARTFPRS
jgi:hypothetical protein